AVRVPLFDTDALVTREEFEAGARPWLDRTVELTASTVARTGLRQEQVAGVFLVGGSSRIPLVGTLLHQRLGIAPTLIEAPELVVSLGSIAAGRVAAAGGPAAGAVPAGGAAGGAAAAVGAGAALAGAALVGSAAA